MNNKTDYDHPGRQDILHAIAEGSMTLAPHFAECDTCRELYEFLKTIHSPYDEDLIRPSAHAVARMQAIPLLLQSQSPAKRIAGIIAYDSWAALPAVQLRDAARGVERRLRLDAGDLTLELVADRQPGGWDFTARVYRGEIVVSGLVLKVGKKRLVATSQDCFFWSSVRPPKRVELLSPETRIDFEIGNWSTSAAQ